jgi:hypothetical protein
MNHKGLSLTGNPVLTQLIIPLPEKSVSVNDTWDFNLESEIKGRQKGNIVVTGQCLLYDIDRSGTSPLATIIINSETKRDVEFNMQSPQGSISGNSTSVTMGTHLVYFDIEKGRITEIVSEENMESSNQMSMGSSNSSNVTKSTTLLFDSSR